MTTVQIITTTIKTFKNTVISVFSYMGFKILHVFR